MATNTDSFATISSNNAGSRLQDLADNVQLRERYLNKELVLGTALYPAGFVTFHRAGTFKKIDSVVDGTTDTAAEVLTFKDNGGSSLGTLTIASGATAGVKDALTPASNNTFAVGEAMEIETDGGNGQAVSAHLTITYLLD